MNRVSLDPTTPEARRLTAELVRASREPTLTVRCASPGCGAVLGYAADTSAGPLFTSSWSVPAPRLITGVNGAPISRRSERDLLGRLFGPVAEQSGAPLERDLAQGVLAAVAPPPGQADDHPPLLVRCAKHGDAILPRAEVMARLRGGKRASWAVVVGFPRVDHDDPDSTWLPEEARRARSSRQARRRT